MSKRFLISEEEKNQIMGLYEQSPKQSITVLYYEGKPTINNVPLKLNQVISNGIINVPDKSKVELKNQNNKMVILGKGTHDISKIVFPSVDKPSMFGDFSNVFSKPADTPLVAGGIRR